MNYNILQEIESYAMAHDVPIIRHESALFLKKTVEQKKPSLILEIGTAIGYSAILMASAAPQAKIITLEFDEVRLSKAKEYITKAEKTKEILLYSGDAAKLLPNLNYHYDFVFIDAAKAHYLEYLLAVEDKLIPEAVVFADNVLFRGMIQHEVEVPRRFKTIVKRMKQYLEYVQFSGKYKTEIVDLEDGIAVSHKIR